MIYFVIFSCQHTIEIVAKNGRKKIYIKSRKKGTRVCMCVGSEWERKFNKTKKTPFSDWTVILQWLRLKCRRWKSEWESEREKWKRKEEYFRFLWRNRSQFNCNLVKRNFFSPFCSLHWALSFSFFYLYIFFYIFFFW